MMTEKERTTVLIEWMKEGNPKILEKYGNINPAWFLINNSAQDGKGDNKTIATPPLKIYELPMDLQVTIVKRLLKDMPVISHVVYVNEAWILECGDNSSPELKAEIERITSGESSCSESKFKIECVTVTIESREEQVLMLAKINNNPDGKKTLGEWKISRTNKSDPLLGLRGRLSDFFETSSSVKEVEINNVMEQLTGKGR